MKYLDAILRYFSENDLTHREDVGLIISEIYEQDPDISLEDFRKRITGIRRDFFRINKLNRESLAETLYVLLNKVKKERPDRTTKFDLAKSFISRHLEMGFDSTKFTDERNSILNSFDSTKKPHQALMKAFNQLLEKIQTSYKIDLHGVKEYSGIDISKNYEGSIIGFQIKSRSDDISEHMIRSESSKAQDWSMHGFVLVYGRRSDKSTEASIQGAYHHFKVLRDSGRMYCAVIYPELLAELFRAHSITLR